MQFYTNQEISRRKEIPELKVGDLAEWQWWAKLTENFSALDQHQLYLSFLMKDGDFATGAARYSRHKEIYSALPREVWQAELAQLMLDKLTLLSGVALDMQQSVDRRAAIFPFRRQQFFYRSFWFFIGLILVFAYF